MFSILFINATILISFLYLGNQFINKEIKDLNIKSKILIGIYGGLCGCILVFYGVDILDTVHIDFRVLAILISSISGGFLSSIITTSIIIFFRIAYYGLRYSAVVASCGLIILLIAYVLICDRKISFTRKFSIMSGLNLLYAVIMYSIVLTDKILLTKVLANYIFSTLIVSLLVYYVLIYISKTNELYRRLKHESTKDFLTGLNNVRAFDYSLNNIIAISAEKKEPLSILMIDIDFFKQVNDTYGHYSGDLVLQQLSSILIDSCRSFDVLSRNGGEEFTVLLLDATYEKAFEVGERIRQNVENKAFIIDHNKEIHITVSIGVASHPDTVPNINDLLDKADDALYKAKHSGRNMVK